MEIPQSVLEVIGQRLNRLSQECESILTTAAVIGRQFDFGLLAALSEAFGETQLLGLVDEALDAYLIQETTGQGDVYQFSHALVQQTLRERLSTSRRVRLHARIGETLEEQYGNRIGSHAAELAHHFSEAVSVLGPGKLVKYTTLAGEAALASYAHEKAERFFTLGLEAKGLETNGPESAQDPAQDSEAAALLFGLGKAQSAAVHRSLAVVNLNRSFDYYAKVGDTASAVEVAGFPMMPGRGRVRVTHLIAKGLELAPPGSIAAGKLLSRYGWAMGSELGDYQKSKEALDQALVIAQHHNDQNLEITTRSIATEVDLFHLRFPEVLENCDKVLEMAHRVNLPQAEVLAHINASMVSWTMGDYGRAQRHLDAAVPLAEKVRDNVLSAGVLFINAATAHHNGEWDRIRQLTDRGLAYVPTHPALLLARGLSEYDTGNLSAGDLFASRIIRGVESSRAADFEFAFAAYSIGIFSYMTGSTEGLETIKDAALKVLDSPSATPFSNYFARIGMAFWSILSDDASEMDKQYQALENAVVRTFAYVPVDRVQGILAARLGRLDQAISHFETAMEFLLQVNTRPTIAWTEYDYAEALLRRNGPGDRSQSEALIAHASSICAEMGMSLLQGRLATLQEEIESQPARAPIYPDGLTQREVEVLSLVAAGKTDREIAEELFIALRTVTTHVGNILNKIGAANRTEAASYATRQGLT